MKLFAILGAVATALAVQYLVLIRPWYQSWGATHAEMQADLPGDALAPDAAQQETRAITIAAPPAKVWPWLAQLGQDRAGFYGYGVLQSLFGADMPRGDRLLGLPDPRPGDRLLMAPRPSMGGRAYAVYEEVAPGEALVLRTYALRALGHDGAPPPHGSWAFVLRPADGGRATRLLVRSRTGSEHAAPSLAGAALGALVIDPIHFAFERALLLGVKARAEGRPPAAPWQEAAEVGLWFATVALGAAAVAPALLRRGGSRALAGGLAAAFVLTLLFFGRPPLALATVAVAALLGAAVWAWSTSGEGESAPRSG